MRPGRGATLQSICAAGGVVVGVALATLPGSANARDPMDALLVAHGACVADNRPSGECAEIITGHCLRSSDNLRALTKCRLAASRALEGEAERLIGVLATQDARAQATELADGAARYVDTFCASLKGRMAEGQTPGQDVRCRLMRAHITVYHLGRFLREMEHKI